MIARVNEVLNRTVVVVVVVDSDKSWSLLVVCQLSRDVIGYEDS